MVRDKFVVLQKVRDSEGWLANQEAFYRNATKMTLGEARVINGYEFGLPLGDAYIDQVKVVDGVVKRYFMLSPWIHGCDFLFLSSWLEF